MTTTDIADQENAVPELKLISEKENLHGIELTRLSLSGFINASTFQNFQSTLDMLLQEEPKEVVLDFSEVQYINSTGMSTLVNYRNVFQGIGSEMVILKPTEPVFGIFSLIGLPDIIPVFHQEVHLIAYVNSGKIGERDYNAATDEAQALLETGKILAVPDTQDLEPISAEETCVLMVLPKQTRFSNITRMRLAPPSGKFELAFKVEEGLEMFDKLNPDLVIIEDRMEDAEKFVETVKVQKSKSITAIIRIYGQDNDLNKQREFKIWEDAYLIEPFEMKELFSLCEAELKQIPKNREILLHLTHLEFEGTSNQVDRAKELTKKILSVSGLSTNAQTELQAAISEGIDNGVLHGHKGNTENHIDLKLLLDKEKVEVRIEDEGDGFDYRKHIEELKEDGSVLDDRPTIGKGKTGGLGIHLMSRCTDTLEYIDPGNCMRMVKHINSSN